MIKVRTLYFKTADLKADSQFWTDLLGFEAHKKSDFYTEYKCENINLGLLSIDGFKVDNDKSNCIPVFEFGDTDFSSFVKKAQALGAQTVVDISEHPDKMSYVFTDPSGNEFEVTKFHD